MPNVLVTLAGATVVLRAVVRPDCVVPMDARDTVPLRATVTDELPRDVVAVDGGVALFRAIVVAARDADVLRVFSFVTFFCGVAVRDIVLFVSAVLAIVFFVVFVCVVVIVRPARAITFDDFSVEFCWAVRFTVSVPRTTASAFAMLMQHAAIKNKSFLISCYIYTNDNKNMFL